MKSGGVKHNDRQRFYCQENLENLGIKVTHIRTTFEVSTTLKKVNG